MTAYLLFRLYGPLAAWGDIAVGERRPSQTHPSKSAIVGMLAAALGIRRNESEKLAALAGSFGLGVRQDSAGEFLRDYHTTQVPPQRRGIVYRARSDELGADSLNTILSTRDYRQDALYTVALWLLRKDTPYELSALQDALQRPRFALYLGRKSCPPALPLAPCVIEAGSLREAWAQVPAADDFLRCLKLPAQVSYYWETMDAEEAGFPADGAVFVEQRRDQPLSRTSWQFTDREEFRFVQEREV